MITSCRMLNSILHRGDEAAAKPSEQDEIVIVTPSAIDGDEESKSIKKVFQFAFIISP